MDMEARYFVRGIFCDRTLKHLDGVAVEAVQPVGHVVEVLEVQPVGLAAYIVSK